MKRLHVVIAPLLIGLLASCYGTNLDSQTMPLATPTSSSSPQSIQDRLPLATATPAINEKQPLITKFTQLTFGATEQDVINALGTPTQRIDNAGEINLWYDPPAGWVTIRNDKVIAKTAFGGETVSLEQIILQYGAPERVVQIVRSGHYGRSSTWLVYTQANLALELPGELTRFEPSLQPHGTETSPTYFQEFTRQQGLDGTPLYEVKTVAWPGLSNTSP